MLKGKHIVITLLIIGLLWLNWFVYSTIVMIGSNKISGDSSRAAVIVFVIFIESLISLALIVININKLWNWEFNLNRWVCKLKH